MLPALVGCFSREAVEFIGQCYPPIADELVFSDRLALAVAGGEFTRTTKTFLGKKTEKLQLQLIDFGETMKSLQWKSLDDPKKMGDIKFNDIGRFDFVEGSTTLAVVSSTGDTLLELDASSAEQRDQWIDALNGILSRMNGNLEESTEEAPKSYVDQAKEKVAKEHAKAQKYVELKQREKEAQERKAKFSGVGMKYTSLAMMNKT